MARLPRVGVVGSGIIGLLSAEALVDVGHPVTIVAENVPGDESVEWASPWAGAVFSPTPDAKERHLQTGSFLYYWALAHRDPTSGVQTTTVTEYYRDRSSDESIWYKTIVPHYKLITTDKLPDGTWVKRRLGRVGVNFVRRKVSSLREARDITGAQIIVNASGLGAASLAADNKVVAVRGQTMLVKSNFDQVVISQGSDWAYAIPRAFTGTVIVGGVLQHGNLDRNVDASLRAGMLERVNKVTNNAFADVKPDQVLQDIVGFRPGRDGGHRLEREGDIVHAYGFGAYGYVYSAGVAARVRDLVGGSASAKL